jgi:1,4-dihydroxy-2-naphthoate octaprenyltransferase
VIQILVNINVSLEKSNMSNIKIWWLAIRPKTLSLSWVPVLVGASLAWQEHGQFAWLTTLTACASALLIQIGTNLHNDAKDWERGIDRADRQGPQRATAMGWLSASQVLKAAYLSFTLAFALGLYLILVGGTLILLLGICSIAAGLAYTGGPRPIAYGNLGELFVFLFFGLGAVTGTYYLNAGIVSTKAIAIGATMGCFASAVLLINNYRDIYSDTAVGKSTLVIHVGQIAARKMYVLLIIMPYIIIAWYGIKQPLLFLTWMTMPIAIWLIKKLFNTQPSPTCNAILAHTAQLQMLFGIFLIFENLLHEYL